MKRCAYSRASWVLPTPPSPYRACATTTARPPPASLSRSSSSVAPRPVKSAFRAGTFQIGGIVPGNLGSSAWVPDRPTGWAGRSRAHSSFAVAWAASIRARSTTGCSLNGSVIRISLTRTGIS